MLTACTESMPCLTGVPGKTCTDDGHIMRNAWGTWLLGGDLKGDSHDASFSEGRVRRRPGLCADWGKLPRVAGTAL